MEEGQTTVKSVSSLLETLTESIQRTDPHFSPENINIAYDKIFGNISKMEQHRSVLEVIAASYEPQSISDLKEMEVLELVRSLPGYGELFVEREDKLYLLHRSIVEWLLDPKHGAIDVRSGHELLAAHIVEKTLRLWLLPSSSLHTHNTDITRDPSSGSYSLKYALDHLREAGRFFDIRDILLCPNNIAEMLNLV